MVTAGTEGATSPWAYAEGMNMLASLYAASEDCTPIAQRAQDNLASGMGDLERNITRWMIDQQNMGF